MIPFPFRRKRPPVRTDPDIRARVVIVGGGFGGIAGRARRSPTHPCRSPSSTAATTTCSSRCSTRWRRPALSPADIAHADPLRSCGPAEREVHAGRGRRHRSSPRAERRPRRAAHDSLRLPDPGDRGEPRLLRPRRMGDARARPEDPRGRPRYSPPHPDSFEEAEREPDPADAKHC